MKPLPPPGTAFPDCLLIVQDPGGRRSDASHDADFLLTHPELPDPSDFSDAGILKRLLAGPYTRPLFSSTYAACVTTPPSQRIPQKVLTLSRNVDECKLCNPLIAGSAGRSARRRRRSQEPQTFRASCLRVPHPQREQPAEIPQEDCHDRGPGRQGLTTRPLLGSTLQYSLHTLSVGYARWRHPTVGQLSTPKRLRLS